MRRRGRKKAFIGLAWAGCEEATQLHRQYVNVEHSRVFEEKNSLFLFADLLQLCFCLRCLCTAGRLAQVRTVQLQARPGSSRLKSN